MNKRFNKEPLIKLSKQITNSYYQNILDEKDKEINDLKQQILQLKSIVYSPPKHKHSQNLNNNFKLTTFEFSTSNNTDYQDSDNNKMSPKSLSCSKNSDIKYKFTSPSSTCQNFDPKKLKLSFSKIKKIKLKNLLVREFLNEKESNNIDNNCEILTFQQIKEQFSNLKLRMYKILTRYNKY